MCFLRELRALALFLSILLWPPQLHLPRFLHGLRWCSVFTVVVHIDFCVVNILFTLFSKSRFDINRVWLHTFESNHFKRLVASIDFFFLFPSVVFVVAVQQEGGRTFSCYYASRLIKMLRWFESLVWCQEQVRQRRTKIRCKQRSTSSTMEKSHVRKHL